MSASGSNVHRFLRVANFCTWVIKNEQRLSTVLFQRVDKFKVYTLNKLKTINFFLHNIIKWLRVLIEKINSSNLGWNVPTFNHSNIKYILPESLDPTKDIKKRFSVHKFGEGKMCPFALHKIPNQTVVLSQVRTICIHQKQPQIIKSITDIGTKTQIKTSNIFVPNEITISFQRFDCQIRFYPNWYYQCDQASSFKRSKFLKWILWK